MVFPSAPPFFEGTKLRYIGSNPEISKTTEFSVIRVFTGQVNEFWRDHDGSSGELPRIDGYSVIRQADNIEFSITSKDSSHWVRV